jgi:hypothetical protein
MAQHEAARTAIVRDAVSCRSGVVGSLRVVVVDEEQVPDAPHLIIRRSTDAVIAG